MLNLSVFASAFSQSVLITAPTLPFSSESLFLFCFQEMPGIFPLAPDPSGSDNPLLKVVGAGNVPVVLLE